MVGERIDENRKSIISSTKKAGLSQEVVEEKLGVSRQTISKCETDGTLPDIYQAKKLAKLYQLSLDELMEFDIELKEIEKVIENIEEKESKINWTKAWEKYPILIRYQDEVNIPKYAKEIRKLLNQLQKEYEYNESDAILV